MKKLLFLSFCYLQCISASFLSAMEDPQQIWDKRALEWNEYIGDFGERDPNRLFQSDPVLWKMLQDVSGLTVLDAGCGEGYLARKLASKGATVIATDVSSNMIEIARRKTPKELLIDYRIESCHALTSIRSESIDRVVSNYVIMDTPNLEETIKEFYRVLKCEGKIVLIFAHPCFPMNAIQKCPELLSYGWKAPYFHEHLLEMPLWANFSEPFIIFHRPLSSYWKIFRKEGFEIIEFDEPLFSEEVKSLMNHELIDKFSSMPHSVAFLMRKK